MAPLSEVSGSATGNRPLIRIPLNLEQNFGDQGPRINRVKSVIFTHTSKRVSTEAPVCGLDPGEEIPQAPAEGAADRGRDPRFIAHRHVGQIPVARVNVTPHVL